MSIVTIGIDLAKSIFAVHCVDENGKVVLIKHQGVTGSTAATDRPVAAVSDRYRSVLG